jgi:NDP-sugar pyrophosphorylase family protein
MSLYRVPNPTEVGLVGLDTGTAPALRTGTAPALRTGTAPALRTGTAPALRTGTAPALRTGTAPALRGNGRVTRFLEKPAPEEVFTDLANAGILVVEPSALDAIPPDTFYDFGKHLLPQLLDAGASIYGWPIPEGTYLLDIGTLEKYDQAQREWPRRRGRE